MQPLLCTIADVTQSRTALVGTAGKAYELISDGTKAVSFSAFDPATQGWMTQLDNTPAFDFLLPR